MYLKLQLNKLLNKWVEFQQKYTKLVETWNSKCQQLNHLKTYELLLIYETAVRFEKILTSALIFTGL